MLEDYLKRKLNKDSLTEEEVKLYTQKIEDKKHNIHEQSKQIETKEKINNEYKDEHDINQFNWGGVRSSNRVNSHVMASTPMFFRRNGATVDLINLYQNKSVFLICNGPSFKKIDHNLLKKPGIITMGINNGGHVFRPNIWTCVDDPSRFMLSIWEDPTIMKLVPQAHFEKQLFDKKTNLLIDKKVGECPNVFGFRRNEKFNENTFFYEDTINWGNHKDHGGGRSVMISSLRLCHLLGFKNVYLVGCDFEMSEDKKYFFDEERTKGAIKNNNDSYLKMIEYFEKLKKEMKKLDFNVYNLNNNSNLKVFEFCELEQVVEANKIDVNEDTSGMYVDHKKKGL